MKEKRFVVYWLPGLHTLAPGVSAQTMQAEVEALGGIFLFHRWPQHDESGACEGFTLSTAEHSVEERLAQLRQVYTSLPIILAGTSFGGWVAVSVAHKVAVDGLMLCNPSIDFVHNYLSRHLRFKAVWAQMLEWWWFTFIKPFRYCITQEDGSKRWYVIPRSFLREVGYKSVNVTARHHQLRCKCLLVVTPSPESEGFLATPHTAHQLGDRHAAQTCHGAVFTLVHDPTFAHGSVTQVSPYLREMLRRLVEEVCSAETSDDHSEVRVGAAA